MTNASATDFRDRALLILSGREHSVGELRQKLLAKGCSEEAAQGIIDDFLAQGYLDDVRFGIMLVKAKARQGWGGQRIRNELLRRGVRGDALESVMRECSQVLSSDSEYERAVEVVKRRLRSPNDAERVFRYLVSHGFSASCARSVLEPYMQE